MWVVIKIKKIVFKSFLKELENIATLPILEDLKLRIFIDFELFPYSIVVEKEKFEKIKPFLSLNYFVAFYPNLKSNTTDNQVDIVQFLEYHRKLNKKEIKEGSIVRLNLNGLTYEVLKIDRNKNKALITQYKTVQSKSDNTNIDAKRTIRVNISDLSVSNKI